MAKFTKSIRFGLSPWLYRRIRAEAKQQGVSASKLVRAAVEKHLGELVWKRVEATGAERLPKPPTPEPPFVYRNQAEKESAEKVIEQHFEEDR